MDLFPRKVYLDDFFDEFLSTKKDVNMKCDIYEKESNYHIEMDIPGFEKKDISIEIKDGYLTISASKNIKENKEDETINYIRRERVYGKYERTFYVGDMDQDKINAEFKNGTLKIIVPKKENVNDKKVIEIN